MINIAYVAIYRFNFSFSLNFAFSFSFSFSFSYRFSLDQKKLDQSLLRPPQIKAGETAAAIARELAEQTKSNLQAGDITSTVRHMVQLVDLLDVQLRNLTPGGKDSAARSLNKVRPSRAAVGGRAFAKEGSRKSALERTFLKERSRKCVLNRAFFDRAFSKECSQKSILKRAFSQECSHKSVPKRVSSKDGARAR